jgi:hypothetical protein
MEQTAALLHWWILDQVLQLQMMLNLGTELVGQK